MSIYNRLTQRDAPVAGPNPNMTPMTRKPMSLRDAVKKYAKGGNISDQYNPQEDASQNQGIDPSAIEQILRMVQAQSQPQGTTPPPPQMASGMGYAIPDPYGTYTPMDTPQVGQPGVPTGTNEPRPTPQVVQPQDMRYKEDPRPVPPVPQDYRYKEDFDRGPFDYGPTPQVDQRPEPLGYTNRVNPDGTITKIGYNGEPIDSYTPEQKAINDATYGINQPIYDYVFQGNGEGYKKVLIATPIPGMPGVYQRAKDGAMVDKSGNVLGAKTGPSKPMDSDVRPLPTPPTIESAFTLRDFNTPDLDAPYPLAPQYPEPVPIAATQQPYSVMPQPAYDQGYNAGYSTPSNLMSLLGGLGQAPAATGGSLGAGGFGGSLGGGLTGGLPGSPKASPSNAQNSNSLDALISMLQQRNRP